MEIRPSNSNLWVACPGAPRLIAQGGSETSQEVTAPQMEGIAAHWVMEQQVSGVPVDTTAPNGITVTPEMVEGAVVFHEELLRLNGEISIEHEVDIPLITPDSEGAELKGRMDAAVVRTNDMALYVLDYKFGWGIVEPYENYQLICYALGAISKFFPNIYPNNIHLGIVQPRPYHPEGAVRYWSLSAVELLKYADRVMFAYREAKSDSPSLKAGLHCMNCPARVNCIANQKEVYLLSDALVQRTPAVMAPQTLGREIKFLQYLTSMAEARLSGLEPVALEYIKSGIRVEGWGAAPGRGNREWSREESEIIALGKMYGVQMSDTKIKSPAKAEAAGLPKTVVNSVSRKTPGELKLVPCREETAQTIFKRKGETIS